MASMRETALLVALIGQMAERGSWCGETHIQKTVYFGRELLRMPFEYEFVLYKHGPFSFDLRDELVAMQTNGLLHETIRPYPYGPSVVPGALAGDLVERFPKTIRQHRQQLQFLAERVANRRVAELERIATAYYVSRERGGISERARARALTEVKSHISSDEALEAVRYVDQLIAEAQGIL